MTKTVTVRKFYTVEADSQDNKIGEPLVMRVGFERGMTDDGRPCWSMHGATEFATVEEAISDSGPGLGRSGYGWTGIKNRRIRFHHRATTVEAFDLICANIGVPA